MTALAFLNKPTFLHELHGILIAEDEQILQHGLELLVFPPNDENLFAFSQIKFFRLINI